MPLLYEEITEKIIGACYKVINELGTGFLESVYEKALAITLREKGLRVVTQAPLTVSYHGETVGQFFADLLIEDVVIVELKVVKMLLQEHYAQLINYLKATELDVGLIVNFGRSKIEVRRFDRKQSVYL